MENNRNENLAKYEECLRDLKGTKAKLAIAEERLERAKDLGYEDYTYTYNNKVIEYRMEIRAIKERIKSLGFEAED